MTTTVQKLKVVLDQMGTIMDRAPWGGGLRMLPKVDQDRYEALDKQFMTIARAAGLTEVQAYKLCA